MTRPARSREPPTGFLAELSRRQVVKVGLTYVAVAVVAVEAADVLFPRLALPGWTVTLVLALAIVGLPVALGMAWAFEVTPDGVRFDVGPPVGEAGAPGSASRRTAPERSIAVLPFVDMSPESDQEYLGDGIAEELINSLARLPGLRVAARTSSFALAKQLGAIAEIGTRLKVASVLEGSVRKAGNRLRITAQLIDVAEGYHLWSRQFDQPDGDIFRIQEEIAEHVIQGLFGQVGEGRTPAVREADLSAYDAFLRGRHGRARFEPQALAEAIHHFEVAVDRDPRFAPAFAGLSEALTIQSIGFATHPAMETMARAQRAAARALDLDPRLPEARLAMALARMYHHWDYDGAKEELDRALELNPNYTDAHLWTEFYWTYVRRDFQESVAALRRAERLSPLDDRIQSRLGTVHYISGDLDSAEQLFRESLEHDPDAAVMHLGLADTLVRMGKIDEGVAHAEDAVRLGGRALGWLGMLGGFYGIQGNEGEARRILKELEERTAHGSLSAFWIAVVYAGLGQLDDTFDRLERAVSDKDSSLPYLPCVPRAFGIHDDPRFGDVLERIGLGHLTRLL